MILQIVLLLILSILVVIWPGLFIYLLHGLHRIYIYLLHWFSLIFSHSSIGEIIQSTLALLIVPLFIGIIFMIVLKLIHKNKKALVMQVIWVIWILLATTVLLIR